MASSTQAWLQGLARTPIVDGKGLPTADWLRQFGLFVQNVPQYFEGTHAQRLSLTVSSFGNGTLWYETDRNTTYVFYNGAWYLTDGLMVTTQDSLPTDLATAVNSAGVNPDLGFEVYVSDYAHTLMWNLRTDGTYGWMWGEGELGSDFLVQFLNGPSPATGWQACNGAAVQRLNSDGTLTLVNVPNTPGSWYRQ